MDHYDVAVIGAGPAGSMAAKYSALNGASTLLLEEHASIGWPVECAGLLGNKAIQESELCPGPFMIRGLKGADVYTPGSHASFKAGSYKAWVVDRKLFDRSLAVEAARSGAEVRLNASVRSICREDGLSTLEIGPGVERISARIVISAEGVRSRITRLSGIHPPRKILSGAQVETPFRVEDPEKVEVHLGAKTAPGLFAWVIPVRDDSARIGLCVEGSACSYLKAFLKSDIIAGRMLGSPVDLNVGGLPLGPPKSTVADGLIAVGDAAGQVKPTSGGGIYPGMVCAKVAGRVAACAAQEGDCSANRLGEYDKGWRSLVGRELDTGWRLNRLLCHMSDEEKDEVVGYIGRKQSLIMAIEEHGDIDRPSVLAAKMLPHIGLDGLKLLRLLKRAYK